MPLDGSTGVPRRNGWIVEILPSPALVMDSRHWSEAKRRAFIDLSVQAAYRAVDAIQRNQLYKQRDAILHNDSWIKYFLRLDPYDRRTILITISHFHFHAPRGPQPPKGGNRASLPLGLVVNVHGSGKRYTLELLKGTFPKRPPDDQVLSSIDKPRQRSRLLGLIAPYSNGKVLPENADLIDRMYHSPRLPGSRILGRVDHSLELPRLRTAHVTVQEHWKKKLLRILGFGKTDNGGPGPAGILETEPGRTVADPDNARSIRLGRVQFYRRGTQEHLRMQNGPIRPNGLE